jgi:hypothetical protein
MRLLSYNLPHLLREFYSEDEEVNHSIAWLIRRLVKVAYLLPPPVLARCM